MAPGAGAHPGVGAAGPGKAHAHCRAKTKGAEEHENAAGGENDGLRHHLAQCGLGADACGKAGKTGSRPGGIGTLSGKDGPVGCKDGPAVGALFNLGGCRLQSIDGFLGGLSHRRIEACLGLELAFFP